MLKRRRVRCCYNCKFGHFVFHDGVEMACLLGLSEEDRKKLDDPEGDSLIDMFGPLGWEVIEVTPDMVCGAHEWESHKTSLGEEDFTI